MTNDELLQAVKRQLNQAAGFEGDDLQTDREHALSYYYQRPNGTEIEGRSTAVSGDVSAMVEASLTAAMEAFSGAGLAQFDALGADDEEQAALESDAVVYYTVRQANGRWHLKQAIKDTLLMRNGWVKVWCEETKRHEVKEYRNVEPEALLALTTRDDAECKVLKFEDGYARIRCTYTDKEFRVESIAPENMLYPKAYDGADFEALQRIPVIAERHIDTRAALIAMGFSREKVERINEYRTDTNMVSAARNPRRDGTLTPGLDKDSELVEWLEVYCLVDGERQKLCCDSQFREVFLREAADVVVYATGQCFVAPHRLTGISVWDKIRQTQDINTALTRSLLDNVQATSKSRLAYLDGKVNPDDIADGRVNGAMRVRGSVTRVSDAVMPFAVPDTSSGIRDAIQHQRQIRTELGGASLDMQSGEMQMSKQVGSMGLDRAFSVAEALAGHITQNIADTLVRSVFLIAHAVLRKHFDEPLEVKRSSGRWQSIVPSKWRPRTALTVNVGMSPGERGRRAAALDKLLQAHLQLEQLGKADVLVDQDGFFNLLMEWARVSEIPNPERYFIDPRSDASQAARQAKDEQAEQQANQQQQLVTQAIELEKLRTAFEKYKTDSQNAIEVWKAKVDARIEYAKLGQEAEIEEAKLITPLAGKALERKHGQQNGRTQPEPEQDSADGAE